MLREHVFVRMHNSIQVNLICNQVVSQSYCRPHNGHFINSLSVAREEHTIPMSNYFKYEYYVLKESAVNIRIEVLIANYVFDQRCSAGADPVRRRSYSGHFLWNKHVSGTKNYIIESTRSKYMNEIMVTNVKTFS